MEKSNLFSAAPTRAGGRSRAMLVSFDEAASRTGMTGSALELAALLGAEAPEAVVATRRGLRVDLSALVSDEAALVLPEVVVVESGWL